MLIQNLMVLQQKKTMTTVERSMATVLSLLWPLDRPLSLVVSFIFLHMREFMTVISRKGRNIINKKLAMRM